MSTFPGTNVPPLPSRRMLPWALHWVLLGSMLLVSQAWAGERWELVAHEAGIRVERRRAPGTRVDAVRASTHAPFPPSVIFATLWTHEEYGAFVPYVKKLEILRQTAQEKVIYEQLKMPPLVSDRDYTVKITAEHDARTGVIQMRFVTVADEGPLEPTADGGSAVTYVVTSDPGGTLPVWLINAAQHEAIPHVLKAMLQRVGQNAHK